jgi:hypothetical protein
VFHSVVDLQAAINRFIDEHNKEPKPFVWTADPNENIAAVNRGHQTLRTHHYVFLKQRSPLEITQEALQALQAIRIDSRRAAGLGGRKRGKKHKSASV